MSKGNDLFGYTGYQNDGTGLLYAQSRYYMPEIRRFISEDSYKGVVQTPIIKPSPAPSPDHDVGRFQKIFNKCGEYQQIESIVITGSYTPDGYSERQFVEASIKQIKELKAQGKKNITWIVGSNGHDLGRMKGIADDLGVNYGYINDRGELINYINNGQNRGNVKIKNISVFSHGLPGTLALGYHTNDNLNITINNIKESQLSSNAFTSNVFTHFYSCNTGTDSNGTSFAQEWVDQTGGSAKAVVDGTTDYYDINKDRGWWWETKDRIRRNLGYGYDNTGCKNYPKASDGIKWNIFNKNK
ncbi:MAG: DUF4347 domain-containing protein [Clostridiales bacterium]